MTYPMTLRVETTPDNPRRGALLYGPVVLVGNLGTEGMDAPAPFSDPTVRNDYYTYNYHIPANLPSRLKIDPADPLATVKKGSLPLHFMSPDGVEILPLYDAHRCRYVVYWEIENSR